ncbi:ATP-binding protein [Actinoplanes sp. NPDC048967]|uniref:sensor histidine kinase n=1 Tax=Actinoplanes sp. NPDC048967 TaxID=3155269 RepID=UPI0033D47B2F
MPDTPYLIAVVAVLAAVAFAVRAARHSSARSSGRRVTADETPSALAETQSQLAAARSQIDQLTERLRQAPAVEAVRVPAAHADGRHVEVFVNLSRRLQSLVHREIKLLDALENEVEDPDLLKGLFQVDHLATRIRRHAENLAVLGGSVSRRQWSRPVALTEVLRSAIAEVEHYSRVKLVPPIEGTVPGHAVASVIHLIAELIENATMFAPPHTQVLLRAQQVAAGMAIEVEDRGLGMQRVDLDRVNQLLANPEDTNLDDLLRDGRIGLYVVSMIARQHGIVVQLQTNIYGGTQAVVILPQMLIGSPPESAPEAVRPQRLPQAPEQLQVQERVPLQKRIPLRERVPPQERPARVSPGPAGSGRAASASAATLQIAGATLDRQQVQPTPSRPPLPRRRSQTHMAPQLQLGPPRPATEPAVEHQAGLMASFMNGVSRGEADASAPGSHG